VVDRAYPKCPGNKAWKIQALNAKTPRNLSSTWRKSQISGGQKQALACRDYNACYLENNTCPPLDQDRVTEQAINYQVRPEPVYCPTRRGESNRLRKGQPKIHCHLLVSVYDN